MVPLRDNNPTSITPYVTYAIVGANIFIFLYQATLSPQELQAFFNRAAVVPCQLSTTCPVPVDQGIPEWLTLVTSQFLHGGLLHLGGNMLFLWVFGNNIEDRLGHLKFFIFYISCGVLAALAQWFFSQNSTTPMVGASGAIAGVMGAYILRYPKAQVLTLIPLGFFITTFRIPAYFFLGFWFVQQAFYGLVSLPARTNVGMEGGGVAYWAHAGGFVFGAILGPMLGLMRRD
ncbi:rhomboid family intramembrane serine protease [Gloeocapsopsis dulcis]|uniref:Rhomboid family intramembrane serine protease n=1 Tax=Gloeocapsopsis dulcis AAB1 = 1H9 TaxID=1433147 RepID=A0A6N8FV16_9CHRO|nr:rhomboid family intramembrane serine protease [Gloeocapsopsis dulcis]MUL36958.1 rhomboid family intramembrane serine protease [Gloeocapsopsis dulcis AAB1 = 1H9]WNN88775.1 rhomboid family intramembrane serine protease [Gloeocapsopsis dulcis]